MLRNKLDIFIRISLCACILCGCEQMRGIRRESIDNFQKLVNENNELYFTDKKGHNNQVKMLKIDETHTQIKIPVRYKEEIGPIKYIKYFPDKLEVIKSSMGECQNCILDKEFLTIDLTYYDTGVDTFDIVMAFLLLPISLSAIIGCLLEEGCEKRSISFNRLLLNPLDLITISEPTILSELKSEGFISSYYFEVNPSKLKVSCNKKYCMVTNENNELINEIQINKKITLDEKEINKKIKRLIEEKEELRNNQEKECPMLYTSMFSNSWVDQIRARRAWYRIQCNDWVSRELEKEDQRHKTATPEITEENQSKICPIAMEGLTPVTNNFSFPDKISYAISVHLWEEYQCGIWYRMITSW